MSGVGPLPIRDGCAHHKIGGTLGLLGCVVMFLSPIGRLRAFPPHAK